MNEWVLITVHALTLVVAFYIGYYWGHKDERNGKNVRWKDVPPWHPPAP